METIQVIFAVLTVILFLIGLICIMLDDQKKLAATSFFCGILSLVITIVNPFSNNETIVSSPTPEPTPFQSSSLSSSEHNTSSNIVEDVTPSPLPTEDPTSSKIETESVTSTAETKINSTTSNKPLQVQLQPTEHPWGEWTVDDTKYGDPRYNSQKETRYSYCKKIKKDSKEPLEGEWILESTESVPESVVKQKEVVDYEAYTRSWYYYYRYTRAEDGKVYCTFDLNYANSHNTNGVETRRASTDEAVFTYKGNYGNSKRAGYKADRSLYGGHELWFYDYDEEVPRKTHMESYTEEITVPLYHYYRLDGIYTEWSNEYPNIPKDDYDIRQQDFYRYQPK